MKHLSLIRFGETSYPVGDRIQYNLPIINEMGNILKKFISETYPLQTNVNLFCKGSSGAIIAALVGKDLIDHGFHVSIHHIKKDGEQAHTDHLISNATFQSGMVNVIIDDFISSGTTVESIVNHVRLYTSPEFMKVMTIGLV